MNKNIAILINARARSTRLPRKMTLDFCGTSLLDIALKKLSLIKHDVKYFCAAHEDEEIIKIYDKYSDDIRFIRRLEKSVLPVKLPQKVTFAHYYDIQSDYIMSINACCPFVSIETISEALAIFMDNDFQTMTTVKKSRNIFFNDKLEPINTNDYIVNSTDNNPVYEMAHVFHIFSKEFLLNNEYFWDYSKDHPHLFEVSDYESMDIDTRLDFLICEELFKHEHSI